MTRQIDSAFLHRALKYYYGYDSFRNGQEEIITKILHGQPVLAVLPTGAGKSICFQPPSLLFKRCYLGYFAFDFIDEGSGGGLNGTGEFLRRIWIVV